MLPLKDAIPRFMIQTSLRLKTAMYKVGEKGVCVCVYILSSLHLKTAMCKVGKKGNVQSA